MIIVMQMSQTLVEIQIKFSNLPILLQECHACINLKVIVLSTESLYSGFVRLKNDPQAVDIKKENILFRE
jgi:hypothetical protein